MRPTRRLRGTRWSPARHAILPVIVTSLLATAVLTSCTPQQPGEKLQDALGQLADTKTDLVLGFSMNFDSTGDFSQPRHGVTKMINGQPLDGGIVEFQDGQQAEARFKPSGQQLPLGTPKPLAEWDLGGIETLFEQTCPGESEWRSRKKGGIKATALPGDKTLVTIRCDEGDPKVTRIDDYDVPDLNNWTTPEALGTLLKEVPIIADTDNINYLVVARIGIPDDGIQEGANVGVNAVGPSGQPCVGAYVRPLQDVESIHTACHGSRVGSPLADPLDITSLDPNKVASAFEKASAQTGLELAGALQASLLNASSSPYVKVVWEHAEVAVSLDGTILRHETKN